MGKRGIRSQLGLIFLSIYFFLFICLFIYLFFYIFYFGKGLTYCISYMFTYIHIRVFCEFIAFKTQGIPIPVLPVFSEIPVLKSIPHILFTTRLRGWNLGLAGCTDMTILGMEKQDACNAAKQEAGSTCLMPAHVTVAPWQPLLMSNS